MLQRHAHKTIIWIYEQICSALLLFYCCSIFMAWKPTGKTAIKRTLKQKTERRGKSNITEKWCRNIYVFIWKDQVIQRSNSWARCMSMYIWFCGGITSQQILGTKTRRICGIFVETLERDCILLVAFTTSIFLHRGFFPSTPTNKVLFIYEPGFYRQSFTFH